MNPLRNTCAIVVLAISLTSCGSPDAAVYEDGFNITGISFNLYTANMGIHPDQSVLDDPNNPFSKGPVSSTTKWVINDNAGPIAAFYCWATMLIFEPTGEHQYYAAEKLRELYEHNLVDSGLKSFVRSMAIRGYQAILDHFPGSISYLADGVRSFPLAPLAYQAIIDLGGTVEGGWVLVELTNGTKTVIQIYRDSAGEETP